MTFIRYGKRKWVPKQCPVCGATPYVLPSDATLGQVFTWAYCSWRTVLVKRDPVWKMPQWYGRCGECAMNAVIYQTNPLLKMIHKTGEPNRATFNLPIVFTTNQIK